MAKVIIAQGGRPTKDKEYLIARRARIVASLLKEGIIPTDIAYILSIHPSQVSRIIKKIPK